MRAPVLRASIRWTLAALPVLAVIAGCESTSSDGIRTRAIHADLDAVASADGAVDVTAFLRVGGPGSNTFVDLADGDELIARRGGTAMTMQRVELITNAVGYRATFPAQGQGGGGTPFIVDFERADDDSALGSTVSMPALFTVTAPATGGVVSRATTTTVTWDPAGTGTLKARVSGICATLGERDVADDGSLDIATGDWVVSAGSEAATCDATVILERISTGTVSPTFGEGGSFLGTQRREVGLTLAP